MLVLQCRVEKYWLDMRTNKHGLSTLNLSLECSPPNCINILSAFRTHSHTRRGQNNYRCLGVHPVVGKHGEGGCRTGLHERLELQELRARPGLVARIATAMCSLEQRFCCLSYGKAKELWNKQWVRLQEQAREQAPGPKEALSCCPFDFHACLGEFANLQRALKCVNSCI
jgi:hypothetical protein